MELIVRKDVLNMLMFLMNVLKLKSMIHVCIYWI